ncbi:MAG: AAA family ATPase [Opitutaceae bacterium]|nr:AAA family ATPase [Opitutaceae bacterium]
MKHPYLSRIEIRNFRNFRELTVDLEPTAIFVGQNKAGKSNLIEALRLIFDPALPESARRLRPEDFWDGLEAPFAGAVIEVKAFIRNLEENPRAQALLADCIVAPVPLTAAVTYQFRPSDKIEDGDAADLGEDDYDFVVFGGTDASNVIGHDLRKWLALVVLPALRDAQTDLQTWRRSPLRPLLERVRKQIPDEVLETVRDELDEAKATLLKSAPVKGLVKSINERLGLLSGPVQAAKTDLDFAASEPDQLMRSLRVFFQERTTKPLTDASLGTANLLFLALLVQDLDMKRDANEVVSTIMAIEEPEAHLHPQLQRLLFRYFLGREHPILLTTHSPNIASVAPLLSTVLLRNTGDESEAFTARQVGFTPEEVADLQRYLDVTRAEILFARGVILVEGIAEQFLVTAFAERYLKAEGLGDSLDDFGISVCAVGGTDFRPYWRMLSANGFSIPTVVITDGDPRTVDGKVQWWGIARAKALVNDGPVTKAVDKRVEAGDVTGGLAILGKHHVFVGQSTLELDLLATMSAELKLAYADLRPSPLMRTRFNAAADKSPGDKPAAVDFIDRIESIGKGRFAQRLAEKIGQRAAPAYIGGAIERIVSLVHEPDDGI